MVNPTCADETGMTHAHCSMLASACSIVILLFKLPPLPLRATLVGSTTTILGSLGGAVGGTGAPLCRPIDFILPVRNNSTACLVRSTFSAAFGVLRMRLLHSNKVTGACSGMRGSRIPSGFDCVTAGKCSPDDLDVSAKSVALIIGHP